MNYIKNKVIIITGPTASNKSNLAISLAKKVNGVIINADSSQVYKESLILTNSPTSEEKTIVKHYLYNFITLNQHFKVTHWIKLVVEIINQIIKTEKIPILVGGSGFYINSLINGLSNIPEASPKNIALAQDTLKTLGIDKFKKKIKEFDPIFIQKHNDPYRLLRAYSTYLETGIPLSKWQTNPKTSIFQHKYHLITLIPERIMLYNNINERFNIMLNNGAIEEAKSILKSGILPINYKKVIGLNELINYLTNNISLQKAIDLACQKTRNYAKRQITWCKNQLKNAIVFNGINIDFILPILLNKINV